MSLFCGDTTEVLNSRRAFLEGLGIDYRTLVCAKQIHRCRIRYVTEEDKGKGALSYDTAVADTDALITDKRNLPLAIFTADCPSIFLYDPITPAIGLVHAGWQGTHRRITPKTVQLMQKKFSTHPQNLYVGFGPAIRGCCYEVGREFRSLFACGLMERDNHFYLDLVQLNKIQLLKLGVKDTNISDSGICTSCKNKEFFSYRKMGNGCGRIMSVIMLR